MRYWDVCVIPEAIGPELLRQFQTMTSENSELALTNLLSDVGDALDQCAGTLQYDAATPPARQMQQAHAR